MRHHIAPAFRLMLILTVLTGLVYPGCGHGPLPSILPLAGQWKHSEGGGRGDWLGPHWPEFHQAGVFSSPSLGGR